MGNTHIDAPTQLNREIPLGLCEGQSRPSMTNSSPPVRATKSPRRASRGHDSRDASGAHRPAVPYAPYLSSLMFLKLSRLKTSSRTRQIRANGINHVPMPPPPTPPRRRRFSNFPAAVPTDRITPRPTGCFLWRGRALNSIPEGLRVSQIRYPSPPMRLRPGPVWLQLPVLHSRDRKACTALRHGPRGGVHRRSAQYARAARGAVDPQPDQDPCTCGFKPCQCLTDRVSSKTMKRASIPDSARKALTSLQAWGRGKDPPRPCSSIEAPTLAPWCEHSAVLVPRMNAQLGNRSLSSFNL